ncbi:hypothetical protein F5Y01DRAFT_297285, partial [Xylaria sp. FL0043]
MLFFIFCSSFLFFSLPCFPLESSLILPSFIHVILPSFVAINSCQAPKKQLALQSLLRMAILVYGHHFLDTGLRIPYRSNAPSEYHKDLVVAERKDDETNWLIRGECG